MNEPFANDGHRIPVGTHYRVWWFWLPLILGAVGLLLSMVLLPVARPVAAVIGLTAVGSLLWSALSAMVISRGRRWLEHDDSGIRVSDRDGTLEFSEEDVTDLALSCLLHHAGGRLIAETRELRLWIETPAGPRQVRLVNRMAPFGRDPLEGLIERLRDQLTRRASSRLAVGEAVAGNGWQLDVDSLHVNSSTRETTVPLESISAVETIGQELRIWTRGNPRAVVRLPLSSRNTWMLPRLLSSYNGPSSNNGEPASPERTADHHHDQGQLGRILFERTSGPAASILFAIIGALLTTFSVITLYLSILGAEPVGIVLGVLLGMIGVACLIGAFRVRRTRFCCHEHGLERVTLTTRQVLPFASIDVFSFESRRNHSHGRYTGTTYTLVFADRSREQGRGIFFSTTVRNSDDELEVLRERVSEVIAHRLARAFSRSRRVQWTPELWFRDEVLELTRPRRLLARPKLAVIPYDTITDFEIRDGLFHIWTNYQERAVITVKTSSANFYPGLIVLEGLVNTHVRKTVNEWTPTSSHTS